jgi:hypothetical protein
MPDATALCIDRNPETRAPGRGERSAFLEGGRYGAVFPKLTFSIQNVRIRCTLIGRDDGQPGAVKRYEYVEMWPALDRAGPVQS